MGCARSQKYNDICQSEEKKFEALMAKYCNTVRDSQTSNQNSNNYGLVNLVSDQENFNEVDMCHCKFSWTDGLEIAIVVILVLFTLRFLKKKYGLFRSNQRSRKMSQMQVFFSNLPTDSQRALPPTAPYVSVASPDIHPPLPSKTAENTKPWISSG